ncbi:unannotated protein [freshwater metagenome]|uniref:Unannotated protein n=1 Tax=freshwater metagenome TaxID=449393 RepID=A0A6J5YJ01_9ZZZZ
MNAGDLVVEPGAAEQVLVGLGLPEAEPWARSCATRAALLAMSAVFWPEFVLEMEGLVPAGLVVVPDDVVRTGDHATGTAGTEPGGDDLAEELLPLEGPALGLCGCVSDCGVVAHRSRI